MAFTKNKDKNFIELLKGSSISLFLKVFGMLFGYLIMVFITNYYGAEEWGIYSLCITVLSISILLPKFGFDNSLVRIITELKINNNNKEIIKVVYKSLFISIIISFVIIFIINVFSDFLAEEVLKKAKMKPYIKLISFTILPITILTIINATFQALKKIVLFMLFQTTLINIVFLFLLMLVYWKQFNIPLFKLYFLSVSITVVIAMLFLKFNLSQNQETPIEKEQKYSFKKIINISTPMLLSNSFALLMSWSDILLLSYYQETTDIGIYNSSLKLALLSTIPLIAVNSIATPKIVEFFSKKDSEGLKDTVQKSTKMIFFTSTPILLILMIFSKQLLSLLGDEFIVGYMALIYLCLSRFINAISGSVGFIMQMTNQQRTYQNVILVAFFINLILNFILIPKYSYNGAAIASSIAMVFWNIALIMIIKKRLGFWTIYNPFKFIS